MSFTHKYRPPHPILVDPVIEDSWAFSVFPALPREFSSRVPFHGKWCEEKRTGGAKNVDMTRPEGNPPPSS